jgi:6-phosphogluconolactonase
VAEQPGAGPRHLVFHPDGRHAYLVNELAMTLSVYALDSARGTLVPTQQGVRLAPAGHDGRAAADVRVHPGGRFLYASNRLGDQSTLAIFAIQEGGARVALVGHEPSRGRTPRNFALDAAGRMLLVGNQQSDNVAMFRIEAEGAALRFLGAQPVAPGPFCVGIYRRL